MKAFIIISVICAVVAASIWLPQLMINPGRLTIGHAKIEDQCTSCHGIFSGIDEAGCIACHKPDEIDKDFGTGVTGVPFHASLREQACISCHTDHRGSDPSLSRVRFTHSVFSASILAKCNSCHITPADSLHQIVSAACGGCHSTRKWYALLQFDHELIKVAKRIDCVSCHKKPNDDLHLSLQNNCSECHSTSHWSPATYDHSDYFILDEDHNAKCNTCHVNTTNIKIYSCYGCHEHTEVKIREEHNEEGIYNFADCASCHKSGDEHDIRLRENDRKRSDVDVIREYVESGSGREKKSDHDDDDD
jgi:hypothetical protein